MKKLLSILLSVLMLLSSIAVVFAQENPLPESKHDYLNNAYEAYTYTLKGARGLLTTFSQDTFVEDGSTPVIANPQRLESQINTNTVIDINQLWKTGDYIFVYDGNNNYVGGYQGNELAGVTLFTVGDTVKIVLSTDATVTAYGFRVTQIKACPDEMIANITYHTNDEVYQDEYTEFYYLGEENEFDSLSYYDYDFTDGKNHAFIGWSKSPDGKVDFDAQQMIEPGIGDMDLYACYQTVLLDKDEIFSFNNSQYYFTEGETAGYYLTDGDMKMLEKNIFAVYGLGPVPAPILGTVLYTMPTWEWRGSCYGLSTVVYLQHYGVIDILPLQPEAQTVSDMELTDDLKSVINYYQANVATDFLTEHKSLAPDTADFGVCLKDLYTSVESGNIVLLTFYVLDDGISAHTELVVGAYTNAAGEHVLLMYDNNKPWNYERGVLDRFYIAEDWKSMVNNYGEQVTFVQWTDTYTQFKAFDITGNTDILSWYQAYFAHIAEVFSRIFRIFEFLTAK